MNVRKGPLCIVDWNENDHPINRLSAAELKSFQHAERSRPCALRIATMDKNGKWTKERVVP
jgi:hypothetical protein